MYNNQQQKELDKLRNEIVRLKKIIEWYKATYERRSILGVIKSKLLSKKNKLSFFTKLKPVKFNENLFVVSSTAAGALSKLKKQTFCAIVDYQHNANANALLNTFSNYLTTQILESDSRLGYSDLYNQAFEYAKSNKYGYLLFIRSDVKIEEAEVEKMFENLISIELDDIGVYSPASTGKSCDHCKKKNEQGFRIVDFVENFFFFANIKVLEKFSQIDTKLNTSGEGINVVAGFYSKMMGLLSIIDDSIVVHCSEENVYHTTLAQDQTKAWFNSLAYGNELVALQENNSKLLISVIVPCFNHAVYLKECVYSIFSQTYSNYEIILINDGSTDETDELGTQLENVFNQVKYIKQNNQGLSATRNIGLDVAKGDYIQFLDADDYISINKFKTAVQAFLNDPQLDIAYANYSCFEDGNPEHRWTYSRVELMHPALMDLITCWENGLSIPIHCFLFKKEIIDTSRFDLSLPNHEDWAFHLEIASKQPSYFFVADATAYYRMKNNAMSQQKQLMKEGKNKCIANVISSGKMKEEFIPALVERLDYKLAVGIVSSANNEEKINAIHDTWGKQLKDIKIPYYIIIGDPTITGSLLKNEALYVQCADTDKNLSQKMLQFYQFIYEKTAYDFVYTLDDGCFLNVEHVFSTYFWGHDYLGKLDIAREERIDNRYGYFLSRKALAYICSMDPIKADLYEDKSISEYLIKKKITAETTSKYSVLDIMRFNINHKDETEFKKLIGQMDYKLLEYTLIINLQNEFQFKLIQEKKEALRNERISKKY